MLIISSLRTLSPMARRLVTMKFLIHVGILAAYFIGVMGALTFTLGGNVLATSATVGLLNLMMVVGTFAGGSALDILAPRRHFIACIALIIAATLLVTALSDSVLGLVAGGTALGFVWGFADPVLRSYPAYLTDDADELKVVNAALNTAVSIAVILGPIVGSGIAALASTAAVPLFAAAMALASLLPWAGFFELRDPNTPGSEREGKASLLTGFRTVFSLPTLTLLFVAGFFTFFGYGAFDPLESLYYRDVLHVGVTWMGVLSSASGIGGIVGGLLVLRLPGRAVNLRTLMWVLMSMGVSSLIYVGTPFVWVALMGQVLQGVAFGALNPLQNTLVQSHAPLESIGRVSAVMGFGYTLAGTAPLLLAPVLARFLGTQGTLVAASSCVLLMPLLLMVFLRKRIDASVEEG